MDAQAALRTVLAASDMVWKAYVNDLSDADLLARPVEGANHMAWQMGHLVVSEHYMIEQIRPGSMPDLPEGFAERYTKATAHLDDPGAFDSKQTYLDLFEQQRAGTLKALEQIPADELDEPAPATLRSYIDTVGAVFAMQATHWLMHAGQWAVIRRKLGRPPLF